VIEIRASVEARATYPGWSLGTLELEGLLPREKNPAFLSEIEGIEETLKAKYGGMGRKDIAASEAARGYAEHFSRAGKAYPVVLQAEAVASKGRRLSMPDRLVQAMFASELESMILTAGHDADAIRGPLELGLADGIEPMPTLGGENKLPPAGDLVMKDSLGIIASVLLGPDSRTPVGPETERVLFVVYAPPEVAPGRIEVHMDRLSALCDLACEAMRRGEARYIHL
jgi:DNA/RNA-binding domain of Phe-tRNA-synthetase-like protein